MLNSELARIQQDTEKVTVCCGFWAVEVINPYFFENDFGQAITVNGEYYIWMVTLRWSKLAIEIVQYDPFGICFHCFFLSHR